MCSSSWTFCSSSFIDSRRAAACFGLISPSFSGSASATCAGGVSFGFCSPAPLTSPVGAFPGVPSGLGLGCSPFSPFWPAEPGVGDGVPCSPGVGDAPDCSPAEGEGVGDSPAPFSPGVGLGLSPGVGLGLGLWPGVGLGLSPRFGVGEGVGVGDCCLFSDFCPLPEPCPFCCCCCCCCCCC